MKTTIEKRILSAALAALTLALASCGQTGIGDGETSTEPTGTTETTAPEETVDTQDTFPISKCAISTGKSSG